MNIKIQVIIAVLLIAFLLMIINMIRHKSLELRYSLAWMALCIGILIMDIFPGFIEKLAVIMGIASPMNALFFLGFCFALMVIFVLTIAISRMSVRIKELAQELALYEKEEKDKLNK